MCSDCQKADWSVHKRVCSSRSSGPSQARSGSLTNPSREEMIECAKETMALLDALSADPQYDWGDLMRSPATLRHVFNFCRTTWEQYWCPLLAPSVTNDIRANGDAGRKAIYEARDPSLRSEIWPAFNQEKYADCHSRGIMVAMIIQDPRKQAMYGGRFEFTDSVKEAASKLLL
jgi:hypothetical protein